SSFLCTMKRRPRRSPLFPYTTLFRSDMKGNSARRSLEVSGLWLEPRLRLSRGRCERLAAELDRIRRFIGADVVRYADGYLKGSRSEEHTSELQSRENLVCRLLLEKKK